MIISYNNNVFKLSEDKDGNEIWLCGTYDNGYTWYNFRDEEIINKVFYCGELING